VAVLIISLATWPVRAVLQLSNGRRLAVRHLDDGQNDSELEPYVSIDRYGVEIGRTAKALASAGGADLWTIGENSYQDTAGQVWQQKYLLALIIKKILQASKSLSNEMVTGLHLIVPPALSHGSRNAYFEAGLLTGSSMVELYDNGRTLTDKLSVGQRHLLLHFDKNGLRFALFRKGSSKIEEEIAVDLSDSWSGNHVREIVTQNFSDRELEPTIQQIAVEQALMSDAQKPSQFSLHLTKHGAPIPVYVPRFFLNDLADQIVEQVQVRLSKPGARSPDIASISVQGQFARLIGNRVALAFPTAETIIDTGATLALESFDHTHQLALKAVGRKPFSNGSLLQADFVAAVSGKPASLRSVPSSIWLTPGLEAGSPTPANYLSDVFPLANFGERVWIHSVSPGQSNSAPIAEFIIPQLFRKRASTRFRVSLKAMTRTAMLIEAEFGFGQNPYQVVYNSSEGKQSAVPRSFFKMLHSIGVARPMRY
jgi:hypothetical protein